MNLMRLRKRYGDGWALAIIRARQITTIDAESYE